MWQIFLEEKYNYLNLTFHELMGILIYLLSLSLSLSLSHISVKSHFLYLILK